MGDFQVATGGGFWVAIRDYHKYNEELLIYHIEARVFLRIVLQ